jgi:hypothetical protein
LILALPAAAVDNWVGTANYKAAPNSAGDEETVGPFSRYDFGSGVVLLEPNGSSGNNSYFNGFYQSFVTKHELNAVEVAAPGLVNGNYELTVSASFSEVVTATSSTTTSVSVNAGGVVNIYLDTSIDKNYNTDVGFTDGDVILTGVIQSGNGGSFAIGSQVIGVTNLEILITGYDANVFEPDNIVAGSSIFTLRLNSPFDAPYINPISSVMGHTYQAGNGDLKFAADGYIDLAAAPVPESETYAFLALGIGLVGVLARRRKV